MRAAPLAFMHGFACTRWRPVHLQVVSDLAIHPVAHCTVVAEQTDRLPHHHITPFHYTIRGSLAPTDTQYSSVDLAIRAQRPTTCGSTHPRTNPNLRRQWRSYADTHSTPKTASVCLRPSTLRATSVTPSEQLWHPDLIPCHLPEQPQDASPSNPPPQGSRLAPKHPPHRQPPLRPHRPLPSPHRCHGT